MPRALALLLLACAAVLSACGGKAGPVLAGAGAVPPLTGAQAAPPAPGAAATVAQIADVPAARARLGVVDLRRLGEAGDVLPRVALLRAVLGADGARRVAALPGARTAVQVGDATVVHGTDLGGGVASGADGRVLGGSGAGLAALRTAAPDPSVANVRGQDVVQTCLGDPIAQTTFRGPGFNPDQEAVGVGLRTSVDPPAGLQLVLCYAPRLIRNVDAGRRSFRRAFAHVGSGARRAVVREGEYGEDLAVYAALPADALSPAQLRRYLEGGPAVLRLLDRR